VPWFPDGDDPDVLTSMFNRKVSQWPKPNTTRIDTRFRQNYGIGLPAPRASRYLFRFAPEGLVLGPIHNCWFDLVAESDTVLRGESGFGPSGWNIELQITNYVSPAVDPIWSKSGIEMRWIIHHVTAPDWYLAWMMNEDSGFWPTGIPFGIFKGFSWSAGFLYQSNKDPMLHPEWPWFPLQSIQTWSLSECWTFESAEEGFCECNGVDSYVLFDTFFPLVATRFRMEFDIRPTGADTQLVVYGYTGFGSFFYGFNHRHSFQWWSNTLALPDGIVLNEWNHVAVEYDWSIPGGSYSVWIDGVFQITQAGPFVTWVWDEIGRRGTLIAGEFDIKNAKLWDGTPASENLLIDVPLTVNACAVEPPSIKGTTFNMDLPSCP